VTAADEPDEDEYEDYEVGYEEDEGGLAFCPSTMNSASQFDFGDDDGQGLEAPKRKSSVDAHEIIDHEGYSRGSSGSTGSVGDYISYSDSKRVERAKHARRLSGVGEEDEEEEDEEEDEEEEGVENRATANQGDWETGEWKKAKKTSVKKKVGKWWSGK
jgi:hypothetical protein